MKKVWVNGTFDVLHAGHLRLLQSASLYGQVIVGIDSDERVKCLKGINRPINTQQDRREMLLSIRFVENVVLFDSDEELINQMKLSGASTIVSGSDHKKDLIGRELFDNVVFIERLPYSSTKIINESLSNR